MKRTNRIISTLIILAIFLASLSIVAYAAFEERIVREAYSIPTGSKEWNGWDEACRHTFSSSEEARLNVSITNSSNRTITAKLKKEVNNWFDDTIITIKDFTGSNSDWKSETFTPSTTDTYYMIITSTSTSGVNGYYSIDQ